MFVWRRRRPSAGDAFRKTRNILIVQTFGHTWPNLVLAKLGLAKFCLGQTWSGQTYGNQTWLNLDLVKLGSRLPEHHKFARIFFPEIGGTTDQDAAALLEAEGMEVPDWSRFTVPEFRAPQPVNPDVESGSTVGNFTHLLLATPSLQHACICHR